MREVLSLNAKWAFTKNATEIPSEINNKWDFVNLPHCWNAIDGQDGGNDYYRGTCYYAKELDKMELPKSDLYYLEIRGANSSADVYVNGKHLAHHDGGYSTWRVNITEELTDKTLLVITVDNSPNEFVYPQTADFTFYGGLYRDVNLVCVNESHFDLDYFGGTGLVITPQIECSDATIHVDTYVKESKIGQKVRYTLFDADGNIVAATTSDDTSVDLEIKDVHLWNGRKDPYLYTATAELVEDDIVLDNVSSRFGCRTFEIDPERGFILNGEEYPLRGVSRHQDRWGLFSYFFTKLVFSNRVATNQQ